MLRLELVSEFKFKLPHVTAAANDVVVICLAGLGTHLMSVREYGFVKLMK
jgi:hypothetical protein